VLDRRLSATSFQYELEKFRCPEIFISLKWGVLMGWSESDPYQSWLAAFVQELTRLGWRLAVNVRIDERWTYGDISRAHAFAKELVGMRPNVIVAGTTPVTAALHRETSTIPIVFAVVSDPVGAGFVGKLSQPGGNITGFINMEAAIGGKWLGLLKEIAPQIRRAAIMFNPDTAPGGGSYFLDSFEAAARSLAIEPVTARVRSGAEIETAITLFGREQAGLSQNRAVLSGVRIVADGDRLRGWGGETRTRKCRRKLSR
jgi:putative ABC transport system substrate-binding protein